MLQGLRSQPDASADLILAADAMVYVSDLAPVLAEAARVLAVGGLLAFTAETHGGEGVILGHGLRYAHGALLCAGVGCRCRPRLCACWKICPPATRTMCPCRVWSWSRRRLEILPFSHTGRREEPVVATT